MNDAHSFFRLIRTFSLLLSSLSVSVSVSFPCCAYSHNLACIMLLLHHKEIEKIFAENRAKYNERCGLASLVSMEDAAENAVALAAAEAAKEEGNGDEEDDNPKRRFSALLSDAAAGNGAGVGASNGGGGGGGGAAGRRGSFVRFHGGGSEERKENSFESAGGRGSFDDGFEEATDGFGEGKRGHDRRGKHGLPVYCEILDTRTQQLIESHPGDDVSSCHFLVSNRLISKVLAMVSEDRAVRAILDQLLSGNTQLTLIPR